MGIGYLGGGQAQLAEGTGDNGMRVPWRQCCRMAARILTVAGLAAPALAQSGAPTGDVPLPVPKSSLTAPAPSAPAAAPETSAPPTAAPAVGEADRVLPKGGKGELPTSQGNAPVPVTLAARLTEAGPTLDSGLIWRVFEAQSGSDGRHRLVATHRAATPTAALPPGEYLVNAAYGLSNLTRKIKVQAGRSLTETFILNAGGLRLKAALANGDPIPPNSVRYDIYADEADQFGNREKVLSNAKPGLIIRLNAGVYHVVSVYGDANAIVRTDLTVEPGRLTDATINHPAGRITFRLVLKPGGEALADTRWSVLTPGGDVVKESAGALPTHILAAGSYTVLARYGDATYSRDFTVETGDVKQIEVIAR